MDAFARQGAQGSGGGVEIRQHQRLIAQRG
jgi:hypothetical protein